MSIRCQVTVLFMGLILFFGLQRACDAAVHINGIVIHPAPPIKVSKTAILSVNASGTGHLAFRWEVTKRKGKLSSTINRSVRYTAPNSPCTVTVKVKVTDESGDSKVWETFITVEPIATLTPMPTLSPTPTPSVTPTPPSKPTLTPTPSPTPSYTPTPTSTVTLIPPPTSTPTPTPTPPPTVTPIPTSTPTSTPIATITPSPIPTPTLSPIEEKLRKADEYFKRQCYTTPNGGNAFEIYQDVLRENSSNVHAREKINQIARFYKKKGDSYQQTDYKRAKSYYQRYMLVARYMLDTFGDERVKPELQEVEEWIRSLPTPTPILTPTPTPIPCEFCVNQVIIRDVRGNVIRAENDIYSIRVGETVTIRVDFTAPSNYDIRIAWTTHNGTVPAIDSNTNTYTANQPGSDFVIVYIWDGETGNELQEAINITVVP